MELLTIDETCQFLKISRDKLLLLRNTTDIPVHKVGKKHYSSKTNYLIGLKKTSYKGGLKQMTRFEELQTKSDAARIAAIRAKTTWARDFWLGVSLKLMDMALNLPLVKGTR